MAVKKTIAIIGAAGELGRAIVTQFASAPYRLLLVSKNIAELRRLAAELDQQHAVAEIEPLECVKDSCWEADIIIMAVAPEEEKEVGVLMKEVATQKIVIVVSRNENECKELEKILPYSKVVKGFVNVQTKEVFLRGNSETVNEEISAIFNLAGFHTASKKVNSNF